jgi:hypothetical protein
VEASYLGQATVEIAARLGLDTHLAACSVELLRPAYWSQSTWPESYER